MYFQEAVNAVGGNERSFTLLTFFENEIFIAGVNQREDKTRHGIMQIKRTKKKRHEREREREDFSFPFRFPCEYERDKKRYRWSMILR